MSEGLGSSQIRLMPMAQLAEAVDKEDDWTGLTDAASRRKRQNRLNVRAYRRRKALISQAQSSVIFTSGTEVTNSEPGTPCWIEEQQTICLLPTSVAFNTKGPLLPRADPASNLDNGAPPAKLVFPLSTDHLIILLQFNVLRASIANRNLISPLETTMPVSDCSSAALRVLPSLPNPGVIPPSLQPTVLQRTIPHEEWIDIIPHPVWRDNVIKAIGQFDEDDLWADTIGGLFDGFPDSEVELRGLIAWSPTWDASGWEVSEGFLRKWRWAFNGCEDVIEFTNNWRRKRGEKPLVLDV